MGLSACFNFRKGELKDDTSKKIHGKGQKGKGDAFRQFGLVFQAALQASLGFGAGGFGPFGR